jgi:hypothetical protein
VTKRPRAFLGHEDEIVCIRKAYSHVSPQTCLDLHVKAPDSCDEHRCRWHIVATDRMSEATGHGLEVLVQIAKEGLLSAFSNPLIRPESLPDPATRDAFEDDGEKGPKTMNHRILFINGRRIRQGFVLDFRTSGGMSERTLTALIPKNLVDATKGVNSIQIDEYVTGRLQACYEWNSDDDKKFGPPIETKHTARGKETDVVGFRMLSINTDSFTR